MAIKLNGYQVSPVGVQDMKGLMKQQALGALFLKKPQVATTIMVQLLSRNLGSKSLETMLSQFPVKSFESDDEYTWQVIGSSRKNVPLVEARKLSGESITSASGMIGANVEPFYLVFGEDWFARNEVIVGNLNEIYQFRILGEGRAEGSNTIYKVEMAGGNVNGVPAERLLKGERFSVEAAFAESEMSRKMGDVRFTSPVSMRNEFSTVRIQHKVTGSMLNNKLAVGLPVKNKDGKTAVATTWIECVFTLNSSNCWKLPIEYLYSKLWK